ncbi:thymidylate synthase [Candidatus Legionella polyplacis]|uniref:Thymidylate synthase n=1 Tax=Candidatus Legionella polyplacis TaxID=2005262 RepID=A0ABZ2GYN8_9GAMM
MKIYIKFLKKILKHGIKKNNRTNIPTISIFGYQMHFELTNGFPLITTKKIHIRSFIYELLWFLRGETNIQYLKKNGVNIWNKWADSKGNLGPIYGYQWRSWKTTKGDSIDQIKNIIKEIKQNPNSRRLLVNSWNVEDIHKMSIAPCHVLFQFFIYNNTISCQIYQRSADAFLGVPFNIASYSLLTHMIAQQCNLNVRKLIWTGGDCHIYINHINQVNLQISRKPFPLPILRIKRKPKSIFSYKYSDFEFINYKSHLKITAPIAI